MTLAAARWASAGPSLGVPLVVNARFNSVRQTGVQRVAGELVPRLETKLRLASPPSQLATGLAGYAWEQMILPARGLGRLLWSPCNVGPLMIKHQILTIHDAAVIDHPEWFSPAFVLAYRTLWAGLAKSVRQIVTVSSFSRERLATAFGLAPARIAVVPNGVSRAFRPRPEKDSAAALAQIGAPPGPYFVTLSTREPRKNLRLTLNAWRQARGRLPRDFSLLVIGGRGAGRIFGKGEAAPPAGEGIVELGYLPEELLPPLLSGAAAMIYPSLYEGFGLPLLEAMACGAPVITTACGSLPEVGGDAAIYVDPQDPTELAEQIIRIAPSRDFHATLSARSLEQSGRFSWFRSAELMDEIIQRYI